MDDLYQWLISQNGGIRTYTEFQKKAAELAQLDGEHSGMLVMLGLLASRFTSSYDGQPLPVDRAQAALERFSGIVAEAVAVTKESAETQLRFLNDISVADLSPE